MYSCTPIILSLLCDLRILGEYYRLSLTLQHGTFLPGQCLRNVRVNESSSDDYARSGRTQVNGVEIVGHRSKRLAYTILDNVRVLLCELEGSIAMLNRHYCICVINAF